MEPQAKLCFLRLIDLQIELARLMEKVCSEANKQNPNSPTEVEIARIRLSLEKMSKTMQG